MSGEQRYQTLAREFAALQIDTSMPGFYDDANFMKEEQKDPLTLEKYGEWVLHRDRDAAYNDRARQIIPALAQIMSRRLDKHQWLGSCFAVTAMLTRMLDRLGIWNVAVKGSASITDDEDFRNFAIVDENEGAGYETGHSWLIAPPYDIVDVTLNHQRWHPKDMSFRNRVPKLILMENAKTIRARAQDVIAPRLLIDGSDNELFGRLPDQRRFTTLIPARQVMVGVLDFRYVASGMSFPIEPLEGINTDARAGVPAVQIWMEDVVPAFGLR